MASSTVGQRDSRVLLTMLKILDLEKIISTSPKPKEQQKARKELAKRKRI